MALAQHHRRVLTIERLGALGAKIDEVVGVAALVGLAAAVDAAARTAHDLHEMILLLAVLDHLQQLVGILKAAGDSDAHGGAADIIFGLLDIRHTADSREFGIVDRLAGDLLHNGTQRRFHHAAGDAEDMAGAGGNAEQRVAGLIGQGVEVNAGVLDHVGQLAGGDGNIQVGHTGRSLILTRDLEFLGGAGHDADNKDILGVDAGPFGVIGFAQRAEHLLRRLAARQVGNEFGIVLLQELDPARRAGGEHGQLAALGEAVDKLGALLHDGDIGGSIDVEHLIGAKAAQRGDHLALDVGADGQAEALAQLGAHRRRRRDDDVLVGIGDGVPDLGGIIDLIKGADRADRNALAAVDAGRLAQRHIEGRADMGLIAALADVDDADVLVLFADGDAAAAEDALGVVAHQVRRRLLDLRLGAVAGKAVHIDIVLAAEILQLTVGVAHAGKAVGAVVGKQQLQRRLTGFAQRRGIGEHLHPLVDGVDTGSCQRAGALDLDKAHTAGADGIDAL